MFLFTVFVYQTCACACACAHVHVDASAAWTVAFPVPGWRWRQRWGCAWWLGDIAPSSDGHAVAALVTSKPPILSEHMPLCPFWEVIGATWCFAFEARSQKPSSPPKKGVGTPSFFCPRHEHLGAHDWACNVQNRVGWLSTGPKPM